MRTTTLLALGIATSLMIASPALAQHQERQGEKAHGGMHGEEARAGMMGGMGMMGEMMGEGGPHGRMGPRMMGMMIDGPGPAPMMLLHMKDALQLDEAQVSRLEEIRARVQEERKSHTEAAKQAQKAAHEALHGEGEPDIDAHAEHLREAMDHRLQGHMAMVRAHREAADVLTAGQRANVEFFGEMMKMMGSMMEGGGHPGR